MGALRPREVLDAFAVSILFAGHRFALESSPLVVSDSHTPHESKLSVYT